jgi:guanyl-specific ribonuclease Sa
VTRTTILFVVTLAGGAALAQTDGFDRWKAQQTSSYGAYAHDTTSGFSDYLKQDWARFQLEQSPQGYRRPKPVRPVVAPGTKPPDPGPPPHPPSSSASSSASSAASSSLVSSLSSSSSAAPPPSSRPTAPPPARPTFTFHGTPVFARLDRSLSLPLDGEPGPATLAAWWRRAEGSTWRPFLEDLQAAARRFQLNDWLTLQLFSSAALAAQGRAGAAATLLTWFLLAQAGYRVRAGYDGPHVVLLVPSRDTLYRTRYFRQGDSDLRHYVVQPFDPDGPVPASVRTYEKDAPGATRLLDMSMPVAPLLREDAVRRTLSFKHHGATRSVEVAHDRSLVEVLRRYPTVQFPVYFTAAPSAAARSSLVDGLRPLLRGLTPREALDLLLHVVQTGFTYQTDDEQFGREKWLFPDETLAYPASDCEDRSILFSFLVRELLDLPVVALEYPNHLATGVAVPGMTTGDAVLHQGRRYVVADPTYIHADLGMAMPDLRGVTPRVITFPATPPR